MDRSRSAWEIARSLWRRSRCRVKVGAVLTDRRGRVIAWGWNHAGPDGLGQCAERHALARANPARVRGATIHVRVWNGVNETVSAPCRRCHEALAEAGVRLVEYREPGTKAKRQRTLGELAGTGLIPTRRERLIQIERRAAA